MPRTARALHRGNYVRRPHARSRPPGHRRNTRRSRRHGLLAVASVRPTGRKRNAGRCCRGAVRSPHLADSTVSYGYDPTFEDARLEPFTDQAWLDLPRRDWFATDTSLRGIGSAGV